MNARCVVTETLQPIVAFVEGRLAPRELEQVLYHDAALQQQLQAECVPAELSDLGEDVYAFLIQRDFADPGDLLDMHEMLARWLELRGAACKPTEVFHERYGLLLRVQPDWLDVDLNWLEQYVVPQAGGLAGAELEAWLRNRLLELFRCIGEPPEWIQDADWPINENGPLVFLGQLSVLNYFQDEAAAYVFHDPTTGACETIIQVF
jgi:hypothetical protein